MDSLEHRMEVAADAVWEAGKVTLRYFQTALDVEIKADSSPVTVADRAAEELLADFLRREFPADGFIGEERGERPGSSGMRWIVDPIDGTKSFVQGVPLYGVLVGLEDSSRESVLGAIAFPALAELVVAARGEGCFWNGRRVRVSEVRELSRACVTTTGEECFEATGTVEAYHTIRRRVRVMRGWGDAYGHVLVATGRAEAMLDPVLSVWDTAALLPIVEEAGGVFTDWKGRRTIHGKSAVSTNRALAREVRALIPGCDAGGRGVTATSGGERP
jgi:histidinol phosphatase-like enzyme (inositol monophosphatase family)